MSSETQSENKLFEWYRTYIGEPDRNIDVYLGFGLFFASIALGVGAFGAGAFSGTQSGAVFAWRRLAFVLGMASLPMALASIVVLLPVDRRGLVGGAAGGIICLVAIAWFTQVYPRQWAVGSGPTYSVQVIFVYSVGVTALLASTGAALVAYHIDQTRPGPADIEAPDDDDEAEHYSDEEIRQDIEESVAAVDLNWGGVEQTDNTRLQIQSDDSEFDTSGMQIEAERVTSETSVEDQVNGLKALKGDDDQKTDRSESTVDDQIAQLQDLKQRREQEEESSESEGELASLLERIAGLFGRR